MSKFKSKNGTPEVHSARSKLDGLLKTLVDKKDESPDDIADGDEDDGGGDSIPTTPTKRPGLSGRMSRKRRRGKDDGSGAEIGQYHHTYVMKLFDRSVDLAQFEEDTPLYPICRAWMRNQPHNRDLAPRERDSSPEPDLADTDEEEDGTIYRLPDPVRIKTDPSIEPIEHAEAMALDIRDPAYRIPEPVPQPDERLDINSDTSPAPPAEQLLLNHLARWKLIRQRWKEQGRNNETRYADSMAMLRDMFDKQCKEQ